MTIFGSLSMPRRPRLRPLPAATLKHLSPRSCSVWRRTTRARRIRSSWAATQPVPWRSARRPSRRNGGE
uniref:Uncharacterized protein n=1 Tax=Arundo donax TaxID=35708 RepID=A0A0A9AET0_ARUDO